MNIKDVGQAQGYFYLMCKKKYILNKPKKTNVRNN